MDWLIRKELKKYIISINVRPIVKQMIGSHTILYNEERSTF